MTDSALAPPSEPAHPDPGTGADVAASQVHLWLASLEVTSPMLAELAGLLDPEEAARADRFYFPRDRMRFVVAHGRLRQTLARYAGEPPGTLRFALAPGGKPHLPAHPWLSFNLSHAGDRMLVGVARERRLGVDLERVVPPAVVAAVSPLVFSPPELAALGELDPLERLECFARLWTRKEAFIKADGRGMSLRLDQIDVWTAAERVRLLQADGETWSVSADWTVRSVPSPDPAYALAVAADGATFDLTLGTDPINYFRLVP